MRRHSIVTFVSLSFVLLVGGVLMGIFAPGHSVEQMAQQLQSLARTLQGQHSILVTIWTIFYHNVIVAILMIATGTLLGLYPVFMMWTNGVLVGFVVGTAGKQAHVSDAKIILFSIVPHGIFELSALIWACGLGLHLGFTALQSFSHRIRQSFRQGENERLGLRWRTEAIYCARKLPWIVGLLLIAACVEGLVTPKLIHFGLHLS